MRPGTVRWIGLRPERRAPLQPVEQARLDPLGGLAGDHSTSRTRQVTLIGAEDLAAIASFLGLACVLPGQLRRNIVIAGLNLGALKGRSFRLGGAVLEATGACHPCSRMEAAFGPGGYNAVRGHGGITARVLVAGTVRIDDPITVVDEPPRSDPPAGMLR
jgi:MOSC domain-containing protein YiiM